MKKHNKKNVIRPLQLLLSLILASSCLSDMSCLTPVQTNSPNLIDSLFNNQGSHWVKMNGQVASSFISCFAVVGTNIFAGTAGGGVFRSSDNGTSWVASNTGLPSVGNGVDNVEALAANGTNLFVATETEGIFLSTDNGTSWTAVDSGLPYDSTSYYYVYTPVYALTIVGSNLFAGTSAGVFRSSDNGVSWTASNDGLPTNSQISDIASIGTNLFLAAYSDGNSSNNGNIFRSTANGTSWVTLGTGLLTNPDDVFRHLLVSGSNLFAESGEGIFRTTDNGVNWTNLGNIFGEPLAVSGTSLFSVLSGEGIDGGVDSFFVSKDNGSSWTLFDTDSLPNPLEYAGGSNTVNCLLVNGTNLLAGTLDGIWRRGLPN